MRMRLTAKNQPTQNMMMKKHYPTGDDRMGRRPTWQLTFLAAAVAFSTVVQAQVIFNEDFTGGASTSGFTVGQLAGTCTWTYGNPGARVITGAGFDADFAIFDSDICGSSADSSAAALVSPAFDASGGGNFVLTFDQSFREVTPTVANVEVWDGSQWNVVYSPAGSSVGYPNPAVTTSINITGATGASAVAQVRFHYGGDWRYWWAVDNISLESVSCIYPSDLAVTAITETGATVSWTDNGSVGYEWAVTTGSIPNNTNTVASGDGSGTGITGLNSGTPYTAWVRADCGDGTFSPWSNGASFITGISNDECIHATALTVNPDNVCTVVTPGTVAGATASGIPSTCGGTADDDVWFSFTATDSAHYISLIDITGSTTDMYMALWSGSCNDLVLVPGTCSDPQSMTAFDLSPGETYYLQVYTYTSTPGQTSVFNVCIGTPPPPPANDECSGALALTVNPDMECGTVTAGTVASATPSNLTSTCFGTADDDVWFSFTAVGTSHSISLNNVTGSTTDMYMAVWSGDCGSLELLPNSCSDPNSMIVFGLTPGETYYLQVYTYTATSGQTSMFDVCVGTPPPPPANDECAGAYDLTVNPNFNCDSVTAGTVTSATPSNVSSTCGGTANDDVWFSFTATDTLHRISLENITGSTSDMFMALWTGDCNNLSLVPNSCSDPQTMNIGGLTPGTQYYLQVYSYTSTTGQTSVFDVCVGTEPFCQPPLNIEVDSITAPNATISWTDNGAMAYEYELRISGDVGSGATGLVTTGTVGGSPLNLTGLVADSMYVLYVRSICSAGDTSSWSNGLIVQDGYCTTIDFGVSVEPICNVTFAGINNDSPSVVDSAPALEDFTSLIAAVDQGGTYTISATGNTAGPYTTFITAFFDWDQNGSLETAVQLGSINSSVCDIVISATVNVPLDAALGQTRMRVVKSFNNPPTDPCGIYSYGQAEDYTVAVSSQTGTPDCEGVVGGDALPGTTCIGANGFGGVWTSACDCVENVGIEEIVAKNGIAVYPNPASTELMIATANGQPVHVKVYDMVGHLAMERNLVTRLDITDLAPGSYNLVIVDGNNKTQAHARFVKQ